MWLEGDEGIGCAKTCGKVSTKARGRKELGERINKVADMAKAKSRESRGRHSQRKGPLSPRPPYLGVRRPAALPSGFLVEVQSQALWTYS